MKLRFIKVSSHSPLRRQLHLPNPHPKPVAVRSILWFSSLLSLLLFSSPALAATYYISPSGDDTRSQTQAQSSATPWKTFGRLFNSSKILQPGDTLILMDGTYGEGTTGLLNIVCANSIGFTVTANSGQPGLPITIKAQNQRKALLYSTTGNNAANVYWCSYYAFEGIAFRSSDVYRSETYLGYPLNFYGSDYIILRRALLFRPNAYYNVDALGIDSCDHVLVEDNEFYDFHRHAWGSNARFLTARRVYMNRNRSCAGIQKYCFAGSNLGTACSSDAACGGTAGACRNYFSGTTGGCSSTGEIVAIYPGSDSLLENIIVEDTNNTVAVLSNATSSSAPRTCAGGSRQGRTCGDNNHCPGSSCSGTPFIGGQRNTLIGSIVIGARLNPHTRSSYGCTNCFGDSNVTRHTVLIGGVDGYSNIASRSQKNLLIDHLSTFGSATSGIEIHDTTEWDTKTCGSGGTVTLSDIGGCSVTITNTSVSGAAGPGLNIANQTSCSLSNVNVYSSGASTIQAGCGTTTNLNPGYGTCYAWPPDGSLAKSNSLGATVLYAYQDSVLTGQPLWRASDGQFLGCGATVPGINDDPASSCIGVHTRLNINRNGCAFPSGYVGWGVTLSPPSPPSGLRILP